jgi:hypothetical protein
MVNGITEMDYRNFSPAKIGHWQTPQLANIDSTRHAFALLINSEINNILYF